MHRHILGTDVKKIYRQILVHPKDRDLQRIIWRFDSQESMREYRLNTVTYTFACAPFLAMRIIRLAEHGAETSVTSTNCTSDNCAKNVLENINNQKLNRDIAEMNLLNIINVKEDPEYKQ